MKTCDACGATSFGDGPSFCTVCNEGYMDEIDTFCGDDDDDGLPTFTHSQPTPEYEEQQTPLSERCMWPGEDR